MTTKHTPGPWFVIDDTCIHGRTNEQVGGYTIATHPEHCIGILKLAQCLAYGTHGFAGKATAEANAQLIAAAPDLLKSLVTLVRWHKAHEPISFLETKALEEAEAAIAKATGEEGGQS